MPNITDINMQLCGTDKVAEFAEIDWNSLKTSHIILAYLILKRKKDNYFTCKKTPGLSPEASFLDRHCGRH